MTAEHDSSFPKVGASGKPAGIAAMESEVASPEAPSGPALSLEPLPAIARSEQAFRGELDDLLNSHPGEWVAYHNGQRIALARTDSKLRAICRKLLGDCDEILIRHIDSGGATDDWEVLSSL